MPIILPPDQYATVDGLRVRYLEVGSGTPLVLLHGLGNSSLIWHRVLTPLSEGARIIAVDLPGHGLSDVPVRPYTSADGVAFMTGFLDTLEIPRAVLAGNSLGGSVALETALVAPQRVQGLALIDSAGLGREIHWSLRLGSIKGVGERFERPTLKHMRELARLLMYDPAKIELELLQDMARFRARAGATPFILALLRYGVTPFGQRQRIVRTARLRELSCPTLVAWGREDRLFPVKQALRAQRAAPPDTQLHVFTRCGHWPELEDPAAFTRVMQGFLQRCELSGPSPQSSVR